MQIPRNCPRGYRTQSGSGGPSAQKEYRRWRIVAADGHTAKRAFRSAPPYPTWLCALAAVAQVILQPVEFFVTLEVDHDPAAPFGRLADVDLGPDAPRGIAARRGQVLAAALAHRPWLGVAGHQPQGLRRVGRLHGLLHQVLDAADAQPFALNPLTEFHLLVFVIQRQQGPGMPLRDRPATKCRLHIFGQLEQADQIGHGRAVDLQPPGELFLGALVALQVLMERCPFFECIQILALQVLDDRDLGGQAIIDVATWTDTSAMPALIEARNRRSPATS